MKNELTENWAKFFAASLPMPKDWDNLDALCRHGYQQLVSLIKSAISNKVLPSSTILAQVVQVLPGDLTLNFEIPTVVRRDYINKVLPANVFHGGFVKDKGLSVFKNATENLKESKDKGIVCRISSTNDWRGEQLDVAHTLHVYITNLQPSYLEMLPLIETNALSMEDLSLDSPAWSLVRAEDLSELIERAATKRSKPSPVESTFNDPYELKQIFGQHSREYFAHIAPLTKIGEVVMCIPLIYTFESTKESLNEVGGGGCLFVVEGSVDEDVLQSLYLISHKLCSAVSSIQEIARVVSDAAKSRFGKQIFSFISHSLSNSLDGGIASGSKSLRVEKFCVDAAGVLVSRRSAQNKDKESWRSEGFNGEPVGRTIEAVLSNPSYKIVIVDDSIMNCKVNPCVAAMLIEIGRNFKRHRGSNDNEGKICIERSKENDKAISIHFTIKCTPYNARKLVKKLKLSEESDAVDLGGTNWIVALANRLFSSSQDSVLWTFYHSNEENYTEVMEIVEGEGWKVELPASIINKTDSKSSELWMSFRADNLIAILGEG